MGYSAACLSLIALVLGFDAAAGNAPLRSSGRRRMRRLINMSAIRRALGSRALGPVVIAFFLATLGFATFETTLALFLKQILQLPENKSYLFFAFIGLVLLITQGVFYRRLAKRISEPTFMVIGIVFMAAGLAGLAAVTVTASKEEPDTTNNHDAGFLVVSLALAVIGFAFLTPLRPGADLAPH